MVGTVIKKDEDPVDPASLTALWRSSLAMMEIFKDRPAPTCTFLLNLALWGAAIYRISKPEMLDPQAGGICLLRDAVFSPRGSEWKRYVLAPIWPFEASYPRGFFVSAAFLVQGYALEYEIGTPQFAAYLILIYVVSSVILLHQGFTTCVVSLESAIAGMTVVMHRVNPKIHTDGLDKGIRVNWAVEPRWHVWIVMMVLALLSYDYPTGLAVHAVGYLVGVLCIAREPDVLFDFGTAIRQGSTTIGFAVHVALFVFCIFFMPVTASALPTDILGALVDGRVLRTSWWREAMPGSPPFLHMGLNGMVGVEAVFICKLLVTAAVPLLLSPFLMWLRAYSIAVIFCAMYAMNSPLWHYPHIGFVTLLYLGWAFWKLPNLQRVKYD